MIFRAAAESDLAAIVALLADDPVAAGREGAAMPAYRAAFAAIRADPSVVLLVAEEGGRVAATCQITFLRGLSRGGMTRALVEAVRVAPDLRSRGVGAALMAEVERIARGRGAGLVQLTSDKRRRRAHGFYERLGYDRSHEGFKKML